MQMRTTLYGNSALPPARWIFFFTSSSTAIRISATSGESPMACDIVPNGASKTVRPKRSMISAILMSILTLSESEVHPKVHSPFWPGHFGYHQVVQTIVFRRLPFTAHGLADDKKRSSAPLTPSPSFQAGPTRLLLPPLRALLGPLWCRHIRRAPLPPRMRCSSSDLRHTVQNLRTRSAAFLHRVVRCRFYPPR